MQYEEKSNLEERIIAHFDGSLDNASSKSLVDEVMASAEKRALFRAHESLNNVIAAARVPIEAPLETRREIADRIPGLIAFIPGLLGTAETMPILQQSANPFLSFFARMSLQTAVSIGSAIAILTTAGIIVKNNLDHTTARSPKIAAVQNAAPAMSQSQANAASASQQYGMIPSQNKNTATANHKSIPSSLMNRTSSNVSANKAPASSFASTNDMSASDNASSQNNVSSNSNNDDNQPRVSNAFDVPKSSPAVAADIPVMQPEILMPTEDEVSLGITYRGYMSSGTRFVQLNGIGGSATSKPVYNFLSGLEFEIGDRYALRVQVGQSSFARVSIAPDPGAKIVSLIPGLTAVQPATAARTAVWATAGMSYSIPVSASIPIILSADGGTAFGVGIMGILGAAADLPLTSYLTLRPMVTYDIVYSSTQPVSTPSGNEILENSVPLRYMTTNAFGFQVNLMFRF